MLEPFRHDIDVLRQQPQLIRRPDLNPVRLSQLRNLLNAACDLLQIQNYFPRIDKKEKQKAQNTGSSHYGN
jgi:hypothetical protein